VFHVRVQVWAFWWQQDDFCIGVLIKLVSQRQKAGIAIDDQVTGLLQETVCTVGQLSADPLSFTWRWSCW